MTMTQQSNFQLVCEFNKTFDFPIYSLDSNPLFTQIKSCNYRCDLIKEEGVVEFGEALSQNNRVEMLDAVCDHLYVLYGAAYTFGIDPDHYILVNYLQNSNTNEWIEGIKQIKESRTITSLIREHVDMSRTIEDLYNSNCRFEQMLRESMLSNKNIFEVYPIMMCLIINTYNIGFHLTDNLDRAFLNVHESNMSKLCKSIREAEETVKDYQEKFEQGSSPYDSPYYYELKPSLFVVKNKSTGKALKSINYTPADLKQFLKSN
jgi:predicted HAD superfamily Cof-like phosphohydrolase